MDRLRYQTLVPQLLLLGVVGSMLLTWSGGAGFEATRGVETGPGLLVAIAAVLTCGLIQVGLRPAWMGAGFIVAVLGRELATDGTPGNPGAGVYVGLVLAAVAAVLLISTMLQAINQAAAGPSQRVNR